MTGMGISIPGMTGIISYPIQQKIPTKPSSK